MAVKLRPCQPNPSMAPVAAPSPGRMPFPAPTAKPVLSPATTSTEAIGAIRNLIRRGQYLAAYDAAEEAEAHEFHPPLAPLAQTEIKYLRVLALARSGSSKRA